MSRLLIVSLAILCTISMLIIITDKLNDQLNKYEKCSNAYWKEECLRNQ